MGEAGEGAGTRQPRRGDLLFPFLTVLSDALAIQAAFLLSYWLRFASGLLDGIGLADDPLPPPLSGYFIGSLVVIGVWLLLLNGRRMYRPRRRVTLVDELVNVSRVGAVAMLVTLAAAFFYRDFSYSRVVFLLIGMFGVAFVFAGRALLASAERKLHRRGLFLRSGLLIGADRLARDLFERLHRHPSFGFDIKGYCGETPAPEGSPLTRIPCLGPPAAAPALIRKMGIEVVFLALPAREQEFIVDMIAECEGMDVDVMMVPDVLDVLTSRVTLQELEGLPLLTLKTNPLRSWGRVAKRTMDVLVTSLLLLLLSPVFTVVALLIRLTSPGPILFRQERVGLDGKPFPMLKFRSMRVDAEETTGPVWAAADDRRRTPIGVMLRKSSLDELPQLFNVLRGDMSLVGPRPERPFFVDQFHQLVPKYLDRHRVKTGMTGWAQVNGLRGNTSLEERIAYDLYYIAHWSLIFDLKILLMTVRAALRFRDVH